MKTKNPIKTVVLLIGFQGTKSLATSVETHHLKVLPYLSGKSNGFTDYKYQSDAAWARSSAGLKEARYFLNFKTTLYAYKATQLSKW